VTQTAAQRIREALSRIGVASAFDSAPEATQWDPVKAAAKLSREQRAWRRAARARARARARGGARLTAQSTRAYPKPAPTRPQSLRTFPSRAR